MTEAIVKPACSALIAILGTLTNTLSLAYFLNNREKRDMDFLLMLLNWFDLIVCISAFLVGLFFQLNVKLFNYKNKPLHYAMNASNDFFTAAIQCTGFATCVLSVTRLILFWKPFSTLNRLAIKLAAVFYVLFMVVSTLVFDVFHYAKLHKSVGYWILTLDLYNLAAILFVVVVCNLSTLIILAKKSRDAIPGDTAFRDAAITVIILSVLFCFFNSLFIVIPIMCLQNKLRSKNDICDAEGFYLWVMTWVALPLNSALNPLIYFSRSRNMREFMITKVKRMIGRGGESVRDQGYMKVEPRTSHSVLSRPRSPSPNTPVLGPCDTPI